jgi:membrane-associated phospholipid phosphatase
MSVAMVAAPAATRPWGRAVLWLLLLGPFFFATYNAANALAASRAHVPSLVFAWESAIPLLPWTIIPYWSIDLFYAASVFVCASRTELDTHGRRLLTTQVLAVACFIALPLRFSFEKPALEGLTGAMFDALASFDQPFNQAPSLHIALLVVLWVLYARHVPRWALWPLHAWFALIGVSVLTTWQHHVVDVPTGAWLGFLVLWLWPDVGSSPLAGARLTTDPKRQRLALRYGVAGVLLAIPATLLSGVALWLLWPAASLLLVAAAYAAIGVAAFQKGGDGRLSLAARWLLGPYLLAARLNTRCWPGDGRVRVAIADGVSLGRFATPDAARQFGTVVDLAAELPGRPGLRGYVSVPMLDLATPSADALRQAAAAIEQARRGGTVLVCCALGYSRSAAATATWLLATGRAADVEEAVALIRAVRPHLVLDPPSRAAIVAASRA